MRLPALLLLTLSACGVAPHTDDIVVRRYEAANGDPVRDGERLGFTYYTHDKGAKHGSAGWNCLVSDVLIEDDDADRIVRVVMHELLNVVALQDGVPAYGPDWYLADGDSRPPLYTVPNDEAAWLAGHGTFNVRARDAWLVDPTREACERLNTAAGVVVFQQEGE